MNYIYSVTEKICFSAILVALFLPSGVRGEDEKEWGVVSPEYLNMTVYPEDTSAAAIIIFDEAVIDLRAITDIRITLDRHFQLKILKESGKEFADIALPYWYKDIITSIDAQIILPDGETIELEGDNIFDEEQSERYKVKKLTFPNVMTGSVLEVQYVQSSKSVYQLKPWYFHRPIPVVESEMILQLDPGFSYFVKTANDPDHVIVRTTDQYFNRKHDRWEERFRFKAVNLPAIRKEPYITCLDNYRANINFQIESVNFNGIYHPFIQDLQTLCNTLLKDDYADYDEPEPEVEELTMSIISPQMSDDQKARTIFEYVRDGFDAAAATGIYVRRDQADVLEQKKASDTEKNLLLKVMLQSAGIEGIPVLISTTDNGLANPEIPFLSQYNKTILLVNIGGNYYLFDARDPWITYGQLPPTSLVKNAMIIQKDNSSFLEIPNNDLRSMEVIESNIRVLPDGSLNGQSEILGIGYASRDLNSSLYKYKNVSEMASGVLAADLGEFAVTDFDSGLAAVPSDTFATKIGFELKNHADIIEDELYLKPGIYLGKDKNIFVSEKRAFPIEFGYRMKTIETNYFTLPDNFTGVEIPKEVIIENKYIKYQRTIILTQKTPLTIGFSRQFEIRELVVPPADYKIVKQDFSKIVDADQEVIVVR